jgi:hypothetical protein
MEDSLKVASSGVCGKQQKLPLKDFKDFDTTTLIEEYAIVGYLEKRKKPQIPVHYTSSPISPPCLVPTRADVLLTLPSHLSEPRHCHE